MFNIRIITEEDLIGQRVVPLSFNQLSNIFKNNIVYLRFPIVLNDGFTKVSLRTDTFIFIKTYINKDSIISILDNLPPNSIRLEYYNNKDFLNIVFHKNNRSEPVNPRDDRKSLNISFEFMISNNEQRNQANTLINNIHKELKYLRDEYKYIFTLNKPKNRKQDRIRINIKNYYDENEASILYLIRNLGDEYCSQSTIFNTLTYALMSNFNLDFVDEDEYRIIYKREKVRSTFR